ncbi:12381_t:CDS:2 [Entrophospora sp. SA101]|nr:2080_t:CDS:2 [Entrophospora sp. SA101]CAJ0750597.1 2083_t:CDS:2 [Entrophospora sp. SA101]CAJ0759937.1 12381_t:CDS:2 [Entrophospora sp. SA101]
MTTNTDNNNDVVVDDNENNNKSLSSKIISRTKISNEDYKVVPPLNFAMVAPGVYRAGHPNRQNFPFLKKLGYLSADDFNEDLKQFVEEQQINVFHYRIEPNKEPFVEIEQKELSSALVKVLGCLRKLQKWSMTSIFDEYKRFAGTKALADQEFIEIFSESVPYDQKHKPDWL